MPDNVIIDLHLDAEDARELARFLWRLSYPDVLPFVADHIACHAVMDSLDVLRRSLRQKGVDPR